MINILFILLSSFCFSQEKIKVKNVSPQGSVRDVEQIRIEFSKSVVSFGDLQISFPAQSTCFVGGQGRWVDTKNWIFEFKEQLPSGKKCEILVGNQKFSFDTGGPRVISAFPRVYRPIEPDQYFVLVLDGKADESSLSEAYFVVKGLGDRLPAEILKKSEAEKIIQSAMNEYRYEGDEFKDKEKVVLKTSRTFPASANVALVWSKNIKSISGVASKEDEILEYEVIAPFKAELSCSREAANKPCIPLLSMRLSFTAGITMKDAQGIYLQGPSGKKIQPLRLESLSEPISNLEFSGPFDEKSDFKVILPLKLKDTDGRALSNQSQFPLKVSTGDNPALLKFASDFGIVEANPHSAMALTLRRVETSVKAKFVGWTGKIAPATFKDILDALGEVKKNPSDSSKLTLPKNAVVKSIEVKKPLKPSETEVVGIPLKENGFYVVEMESPLLGEALTQKKETFFVRSAALVTNMAVHVKYTDSRAWIWVTSLAEAKPVPGARVSLYDVFGKRVAEGVSDDQGLLELVLPTKIQDWPTNPEAGFYGGFFAVAETTNDFTFTHSSWDQGVESWRYQLGLYESVSGLIGHAILDRNLLKPAETLSAKFLLRKTNEKGLGFPAENDWPQRVRLSHDSGLQEFDFPVQWNKKNGSALFTWKLPEGAKLGRWVMTLFTKDKSNDIEIGNFYIESFRIPLIQLSISPSQPQFIKHKNVDLNVGAQYFSGGPAAALPIKVRWSVEPDYFTSADADFQDFSFANGTIKEGIFRSGEDSSSRYIPQSGIQEVNLDKSGTRNIQIQNLKYGTGPQRLRAEVEYQDPSGEIKTNLRSFGLYSSGVVLGIKAKSWWATPSAVEFDVVALDLSQRPLKNQKVQVELFTQKYYSHRKRLVGGFYAYEDIQEYKKVGSLCAGSTNEKGVLHCKGSSKFSGTVVAVAKTADTKGRESSANVTQWIVEPGQRQWFGSTDDDRADLIPFKRSYEPGETAEFQFRTPFPEAEVLVTVERDSVLHREVIHVSGENPIIKIPIKKEYAPNVVVSAFAIRGRLADPPATALIDLGKPAFKLGMSNIRVGVKENTLKVQVTTNKKSYTAREKMDVQIEVLDPRGQPAKNSEVTLIAVDEGLLEIRDNKSWNILPEFMKMRNHSIEFATAQSLVVGKRHFGLKAVAAGGDGAGGLRRELFDSLLFWSPSLKTNDSGKIKVSVPLNDSTTSFRIVAVALQGADQFGTGWTSVQSSQVVTVMPGLSSIARQGENFRVPVTVRNTSAQIQDLTLDLKTNPLQKNIGIQKVKLNRGESQVVHWSIAVPSEGEVLDYEWTAKNSQGQILDQIKKTQSLLPVRLSRVVQSEWGQYPEFAKLDIKPLAPAGSDQIVLEVSSTLIQPLAGVLEFWKNYSFNCLEQQFSKAVSLNDKKLWVKISNNLTTYMDESGLLKYFPSASSKGSVVLTSYVLTLSQESGFALPKEMADRMLVALENYVSGRAKEEGISYHADETLKKISAMNVLSRHGKLEGDVLSSIDYQPRQWPLFSLVEWREIIKKQGGAFAAEKIPEIDQIIRSKFQFSAKALQLKNENQERMSWLMRDGNSALQRLLIGVMGDSAWQTDVPRIYQGLILRQKNGSWGMTTANAYGILVNRKLTLKYPAVKANGEFSAKVQEKTQKIKWSSGASSHQMVFPLKSSATATWNQADSQKPWVTVSLKSSAPIEKAVFSGLQVDRQIKAKEQKIKNQWSVGDTAEISVRVKSSAPQSWIVLSEPIPSGSSVITTSWATAVERKAEKIVSYYEHFSVEETFVYTIRFNQPGDFLLPSTRVENLYSPDIYAELPETSWKVQ